MNSQLSNNHGGWNKGGGGTKVAKLINVESGIFGRNYYKSIDVETGIRLGDLGQPNILVPLAYL